jgi:hypothetical protein
MAGEIHLLRSLDLSTPNSQRPHKWAQKASNET